MSGKSDAEYFAEADAIDKRLDVATTPEELNAVIDDLAQLTETQKRRALATIAGATPTAIAKAEGVSKQSVAKTLSSPAVKEGIHVALSRAVVEFTDGDRVPLTEVALATIMKLLVARKAVVFGSNYEMVPDNAVRFQAAVKILEWAHSPAAEPMSRASSPPPAEDISIEETLSTRRVARRSRS